MNFKLVIQSLFLSVLLMALFYLLLLMIDRGINIGWILLVAMTDILILATIVKLFLRYMRSSAERK